MPFDPYVNAHPNSAFAALRGKSSLFQTIAADVGGVSPWITLPTMHRRVFDVEHEISDMRQDLTRVDDDYSERLIRYQSGEVHWA